MSLWAGNSIFSYDGYPVQYYGRDIYSLSMGDTGSSDVFRNNTAYANPAQSNIDNKTLFGTGMVFGYTGYKSKYNGNENSFRDDSVDFPYFSISIPVKKHRFAFQFASYANGLVKNQTMIDSLTIESQEVDKYLYRADLVYSYRYKNLNLGISGNYFLGHDNRKFVQSSSENTVPSSETLEQNYKNPSISVGFVQRYNDHAFGSYATLPVTLKGERIWSSFHSSGEAENSSFDIPLTIGFGYTGLMLREFKVAADYTYEAFSETDANLRDGWKLGVGVAYEPNTARKRYWYHKIPLRAGYSRRALPFKVNGEYVDENAISAGFSLPLKGEVNRLDLGFMYQTRGSLDTHNIQDTSYMMLIGFTGFDIISKAIDRTAPREIPKAEELQQW
jgi:hypothetical protein